MKMLTRCEIGACVAVAVALAIALPGCGPSQDKSGVGAFQQATVVLLGPPRQMKQITDPNEIQRLISFFPGLGSRTSHRVAGWVAGVVVSLVSAEGTVVEVTVSYEVDTWSWGQGRGDLPVEGDLAGFLKDLFPAAVPSRQATVLLLGPPQANEADHGPE